MAHGILIDELVRQGMPLVKALERQAPWAAQDGAFGMTDEERMVRQNRRNMARFERGGGA